MDELVALIKLLRANGVTKYEGLNEAGERVVLELGLEPAAAPTVDIRTEGFAPSNGRSPELNKMLDRIDPAYAELFELK